MKDSDNKWCESVEPALDVGQRITETSEELNQACEHIVRLLNDASLLLEAGSRASAVFLSITALEETAKIHIGMYRNANDAVPRRKDPLYQHDKKHYIAASPTVAMGGRLQEAIGEKRMNELIEIAREGQLKSIREKALYVEKNNGRIQLPSESVTKEFARELILFAVEAFDDAFVGYTGHSYELGEITNQIFNKWKHV